MVGTIPLLEEFACTLQGGHAEIAQRLIVAYVDQLKRSRGQKTVDDKTERSVLATINAAHATKTKLLIRDLPDSLTRRICAEFASHAPRRVAELGLPANIRLGFVGLRVGPKEIFSAFAVWLHDLGVSVSQLSSESRADAARVDRIAPRAVKPNLAQTMATAPQATPPSAPIASEAVRGSRAPPSLGSTVEALGGAIPPRAPKRAPVHHDPRVERIVYKAPEGTSTPKRPSGSRVPRVPFIEERLALMTYLNVDSLRTYRSYLVSFFSWLCHDLGLVPGEGEVNAETIQKHADALLAVLATDEARLTRTLSNAAAWFASKHYSISLQRMVTASVRALRKVNVAKQGAAAIATAGAVK